MKHLKEGLIKQRGIVRFNPYTEITNPKFEDICKEGNIVVVNDHENIYVYIVLSEFIGVKSGDQYPLMVRWNPENIHKWTFWETSHFEQYFPNARFYGKRIYISKVYKTNINPKTIKNIKHLEEITEDFKKMPSYETLK